MAAPISTALPTAPSRSDSPDVFEEKAFAFVGALEPFRVDIQAQADYVSTAVDNAAAIETVSDNVASVNTVAGDIASVNTVAGNEANVNTVAAGIANVNAVAGVSADVAALGPVASDIPTVAANAADIPAAAAIGRRQALYARSVAENPPVGPETMRMDYANRAYALGDKSAGLIDDVVAFETAHTFTRSSSKWAPDATGALIEYGVNEPAYTYDETGKALGLLIEEQRTNVNLYSEGTVANGQWVARFPEASTLSDSTLMQRNALRVTLDDAATNDRPAALITRLVGDRQKISVRTGYIAVSDPANMMVKIRVSGFVGNYYFEDDGGFHATFSAADGSILHQGIFTGNLAVTVLSPGVFKYTLTTVGISTDPLRFTGWQVSLARNTSSVSSFNAPTGCVNGDWFEFTAFQKEDGVTFPTSYIKTEGTQVTRAADVCSRTLGQEYHAEAGNLSVTASVPTGETVVALGYRSIVSDSDAEKTYTLSYQADPSATTLDVAPGASVATIKRIEYNPRA